MPENNDSQNSFFSFVGDGLKDLFQTGVQVGQEFLVSKVDSLKSSDVEKPLFRPGKGSKRNHPLTTGQQPVILGSTLNTQTLLLIGGVVGVVLLLRN